MRVIGVLAVVAVLGACDEAVMEEMIGPPGVDRSGASTPAPGVAVPRGQSAFYFYRTKTLAGSANTFRVLVDGVPVAQMAVGTVHTEPVSPGPHVVQVVETETILNAGLGLALQKKPQMRVAALSGQVTHLQVGASQWTGGPTLEQVDATYAASAAAGFRKANPL